MTARVSGAVLAGGRSRRMGRDKALMRLNGRTLLEIQLAKLRALGIEDAMVSGREGPVPGARCVPDVYRDKGPLGGLHACLGAAEQPHCFVLAVDVPLAPVEALAEMIEAHLRSDRDATLLVHGGRWEPLLAVYRSDLAERIPPLLEAGRCAVRDLLADIHWGEWRFKGDERLLLNCNNGADFEAARTICGEIARRKA